MFNGSSEQVKQFPRRTLQVRKLWRCAPGALFQAPPPQRAGKPTRLDVLQPPFFSTGLLWRRVQQTDAAHRLPVLTPIYRP